MVTVPARIILFLTVAHSLCPPIVNSLNFILLDYDNELALNSSRVNCQTRKDRTVISSIYFTKNHSLGDMVTRTIPICHENKQESILISAVGSMETQLAESFLGKETSFQLHFEDNCKMKIVTSFHHQTQCNFLPVLYIEETIYLLKELSVTTIAVCTTNNICGLTLSNLFVSKLIEKNIKVSVHLFEEIMPVDKVGSEIMTIISSGATDILVIDIQNHTKLFETAALYGMIVKEYRWIVIDYPIHDKAVEPEAIINLKLLHDTIKPLHLHSSHISPIVQASSAKLFASKFSMSTHLLDVLTSFLNVSCPSNKKTSLTAYYKKNSTAFWHEVFEVSTDKVIKLHHIEDLGLDALFKFKKQKLTVVSVFDMPFAGTFNYLRSGQTKECDFGMPCRVARKSANKTVWDDVCCSGFCIDLMAVLETELNVQFDLYLVEDGYYGGLVEGVWNGMIGDVQRRKADMAIAGLTITKERVTVVDFTEPFMNLEVGILTYSSKKKLSFINFAFLDSLTTELQLLIVGISLTVCIALYFTENYFFQRKLPYKEKVYDWRLAFSYTAGIGFQRDVGGKDPKHFGARVIAIFSAFGMTIIMTSYTAVLTASSISTDSSDLISGIRDPKLTYPTSDFKFAFLKSGSTELFFKTSTDQDFQRMYPFMKLYAPETTVEGVQKVKDGELQGFITDYPVLHYYISKQQECKLKIVGDPVLKRGYGIALPMGSPYTFQLSNIIRQLKVSQVLSRLYKKWFPTTCLAQARSSSALPESKSIEYSGGLQLILVISVACSIGILGFEHLQQRQCKKPVSVGETRSDDP